MSEVVEMNMWESVVKFNEKLTFFILNVKNKTEKGIVEEDYELIKPLCRSIWRGEIQFFKPVLDISDEKAEQQGLFGQNDSQEANGIEIESTDE